MDCVYLPFDVELCNPWLVCEYVPDQLVNVRRRIEIGTNATRTRPRDGTRAVQLLLIPLLLERSLFKLCIDVVTNPDKLLIVVTTTQQDNSHPNKITRRNSTRQRRRSLKHENTQDTVNHQLFD